MKKKDIKKVRRAIKKMKPARCNHIPVYDSRSIIFPGSIGFSYFDKWRCLWCGASMKAKWSVVK